MKMYDFTKTFAYSGLYLFQVLKSSKSIADPCTPTQRARLELSAEKVVPFVRHELLTLRRRSKEVKEGLRKGRYVRSLA